MKQPLNTWAKLTQILQRVRRCAREADGLSSVAQLREMIYLMLFRQQGPGYYHVAGFWRETIPWQHKLAHMNIREYRRVVDRLNNPLYRKISQHKLVEKSVLTSCAIPTAKLIGYLHAVNGRCADGGPLRNTAELSSAIRTSGLKSFCIKPVESWGGMGFRAASVRSEEPLRVESLDAPGSDIPLEEFLGDLNLDRGTGFIVEAYLEQHPWYAAINPTSINSFRIWVLRQHGRMTTPLAYLRMGRAGAIVDNQTDSRLVAPIDMENGVITTIVDGLLSRRTWTEHPDSHQKLVGQAPPEFAQARATAELALSVFPQLNFAGVDVAITTNGPVILELNAMPDREGAAFTDTPTWFALDKNNHRRP